MIDMRIDNKNGFSPIMPLDNVNGECKHKTGCHDNSSEMLRNPARRYG